MRHSLEIRAAVPQDTARLAVLATQVWLHTYATQGINAEIAQYVLSELTPDKYAVSLGDPNTSVLVAEVNDNLIGLAAVKIGAVCPIGARSTVELQALYVHEHFIGQGVGKSLLRAAEAKGLATSSCPLWLTVNAKNFRATAFYAHLGYSKIGTDYFVLGSGRYENHVLIGRDA